jgi:hypothetical protein
VRVSAKKLGPPRNERWLRACLESCLQLPRFFAKATQIFLYRASGRCKQRPSSGLRKALAKALPSLATPYRGEQSPLLGKRGRGRPRHNVRRASSPVRWPKAAWKLAKLQRETQAPPLQVFRAAQL